MSQPAVNTTHYLSSQGPAVPKWGFFLDDDPHEWQMIPVTSLVVASQLERWVVQQVARNSELRRPADDDPDPISWRIYNEWGERTRRDIDRGLYGAMTQGWWSVLEGSDRAFEEVLYYTIRTNDQNWTRDHSRRVIANEEDYAYIWNGYLALNHPKVYGPASTGPPPDQSEPKSPSDGTKS